MEPLRGATAQDEVHEREQHRGLLEKRGESAMLTDGGCSDRVSRFLYPSGRRTPLESTLSGVAISVPLTVVPRCTSRARPHAVLKVFLGPPPQTLPPG